MGVPGALQCRIFSPRPSSSGGAVGTNNAVTNWSLPVWMIGMISPSVGIGLGSTDPCVIVHKRIAQVMNIREGDEVEFEILEAGERFSHKVLIKDWITADVIVHGALFMGIAKCEMMHSSGISKMELHSGTVVEPIVQEMWAGLTCAYLTGSVVLHFDGASRNNPNGPAGYGYHVMDSQGHELIRGYGYYKNGSSNLMEYKGLLEALTWALRLDLKSLIIRGDSELIIQKCKNECQVRHQVLKEYYEKVSELLTEAQKKGTSVVLEHIRREDNTLADFLANLGVDSKSHLTACNWTAINTLRSQGRPRGHGQES
jgi:ribonuclease HI